MKLDTEPDSSALVDSITTAAEAAERISSAAESGHPGPLQQIAEALEGELVAAANNAVEKLTTCPRHAINEAVEAAMWDACCCMMVRSGAADCTGGARASAAQRWETRVQHIALD
jgi:hypothetical protein